MPCGDNPEEMVMHVMMTETMMVIIQEKTFFNLSPTLSDDLMITTSNTSLIPPLTEDGDGILI